MLSKIGLAAIILALAALLPAQAQAPALRFSICGAVNRPGIYDFKPGYRLSDAFSSAAGPTERANLGIIMLSHAGKPGSTANMVWVNFNDFVLHGKMSGNPFIQPGDDLYVLGKSNQHSPQLVAQGHSPIL